MSWPTIRKLLEVRLNAVAPNLPTAFENVPYTPAQGTAWQRAQVLKAPTANPTMGDGFTRELGIFQITLNYPENPGAQAAEAQAKVLRDWFARGLSLDSGKVHVLVDQAPYESSGLNNGAWFVVVVSVPFHADIFP
jgi:hypothetical protein